MKELLYSVSEVGKMLGYSPGYVSELIRKGELKAHKTKGSSGHYRVTESSIKDFTSKQKST